MKRIAFLSFFLSILLVHSNNYAQTNVPSINNAYNTPAPIIYQNSLTTPQINNPSSTLPGAPTSTTFGLPGLPSNAQAVLPGNSTTPTGPSLLQQLYQQPAMPNAQFQPPQQTSSLQFQPIPYETIAPPESYLPGIATIKDKKWMVSDYLYNLSPNIGIKVEIIKPEKKYIPLSADMLEKRVVGIFEESQINPYPLLINCQPPLPMFYVLVMVYPCEQRCIGFVTAQLYEIAKPERIDIDLNGVWQTITWERQALVASTCEDFAQEVGNTLDDIAYAFTNRYNYYHPVLERPCYPAPPHSRNEELYNRYYNPSQGCGNY